MNPAWRSSPTRVFLESNIVIKVFHHIWLRWRSAVNDGLPSNRLWVLRNPKTLLCFNFFWYKKGTMKTQRLLFRCLKKIFTKTQRFLFNHWRIRPAHWPISNLKYVSLIRALRYYKRQIGLQRKNYKSFPLNRIEEKILKSSPFNRI